MRQTFCLLVTIILIAFTSCRSDFNFEPSTGSLQFSKDTVYLDTVFKNIGSSTYTLKVFNKSDKDIAIPTIQLAKGQNSKYRMVVDGMQGDNGKVFNNVEVLAKDSLYIFIETTADVADANPTDFLYTDEILFDVGVNLQTVALVTLIQDAYFIYPKKVNEVYENVPIGLDENNTIVTIKGRNLEHNHPENGDEYIFKNDKPYVIYGYASVPANEILTINAGARVYFHAESGIIVQENGTLNINGTISTTTAHENEVVFEGDRLEPFYSDVPGQWGFVYLRQGSKDHIINHLTLKNATVGLIVENNAGANIKIDNTQIYDCSNVGIYAINASIAGTNIIINSAGQAALACTLGGDYDFKHCTFNNNWPSTRQVAVLIDNFFLNNNNQPVAFDLVQANFSNCIIYGSNQVEMLLNKNDTKQFNYKFNNCLIKFNNQLSQFSTNPLYDFNNTVLYNQCLISRNNSQFNPKFLDINKNKLNIDNTSDAFQKGNPSFLIINDILGNLRDSNLPDIGAYTNKPFPQ